MHGRFGVLFGGSEGMGGRGGMHGGRGGRGGGHGRGGGDGRGPGGGFLKRMLGHGDLRYVILALLEEKPSHGYELIKALEEKSAGQYAPSPGVIYPTLTFLEESGFATASTEENKKLYTITAEGKAMLDENRDFVDAIFSRMEAFGSKLSKIRDWFGKEDEDKEAKADLRNPLRKTMHSIKSEIFSRMPLSKEQQKQIVEIMERALVEIREIK